MMGRETPTRAMLQCIIDRFALQRIADLWRNGFVLLWGRARRQRRI